MKQYKALILIFIIVFGFGINNLYAQTTKLTQMEPSTVKWKIPVGKRVIPGQSGKWFQTYMSLQNLIDSVGISLGGTGTVTSIATTSPITGGTITSTGTIGILTASGSQSGALSSTDWTTFNNKENTLTFNSPLSRAVNTISIPAATTSVSGHLTSTDWNTFNNKYTLPSLTSGSVLFSNGSDLAQDNANFYWNNNTKRLGIGLASPTMTLDVRGRANISDALGNVFVSAGNTTLTGGYNMGLGYLSIFKTTTGSYNSGIGTYSLFENTTGSYNTGVGPQSLFSNTTGSYNVGFSENSGYYNTSGNYNVGIGRQANFLNISGSNSVGIGAFSLYSALGSGNVGIGYGSGYSETGSSRLYIENSTSSSPLIGGHFDNRRVGINTTISDIGRTLDVNGEVRIRDLTTTNPTILVGGDGNGVLSGVTLGTGLSWSGTTLNATGVTGSGTATRVAFWSSTSALSSSSNLYWDNNDTRLGIGTSSPARELHVVGDAQINRYTYGSDGQIISGQDGSGYYYATGGTSIAKPIYFGNSSTTFIRMANLAGATTRMATLNASGDLGSAALMSLTTTGSGAATYSSGTGVLNIPTPLSLPAGSSSHTLAYISSAWTSSSFLKNNSSNTATGNNKRVEINNDGAGESWPIAVNTATKFLVNGRVQMNSTSSSNPTTIMGRNSDSEVGTISTGNGIAMSGANLTAVSTHYGQLWHETEYNLSATGTPQVINFIEDESNVLTTNTSTERITVAATGTYRISYNVGCNMSSNITAFSFIYVNGSTSATLNRLATAAGGTGNPLYIPLTKTAIVNLNANDYVDLRVSVNTSSTVAIYTPTLLVERLY